MYRIMGKSSFGTEEIDSVTEEEGGKAEANRLANEYRMAFGPGWSIWVVKN